MKKLTDQDAPKFIVIKVGGKNIVYEQLEINYPTDKQKNVKK